MKNIVESLKSQCLRVLSRVPNILPEKRLPNNFLEIAGEVLKREKREALNENLLTHINVESLTELKLQDWTVTADTLKKIGENLTALSGLPNLYPNLVQTSNSDDAKAPGLNDRKLVHISNIDQLAIVQPRELSHCQNSKFEPGWGITNQPDRKAALKILESLPNIKVLKLHEMKVDYAILLDLFSEGLPSSIEQLTLPPLDFNDERFLKLLEKCGKNLTDLGLEHAEIGKKEYTKIKGKLRSKTVYPNNYEIFKNRSSRANRRALPEITISQPGEC